MESNPKKSTLIVTRRSPCQGGIAKSALDTALAMAVFDQPVALLFQGEGVLQLLPDQATELLGRCSLSRQLESLPLYDIDSLFVDAPAARHYGFDLTLCTLAVSPLEDSQIRELMLQHHTVLGF